MLGTKKICTWKSSRRNEEYDQRGFRAASRGQLKGNGAICDGVSVPMQTPHKSASSTAHVRSPIIRGGEDSPY